MGIQVTFNIIIERATTRGLAAQRSSPAVGFAATVGEPDCVAIPSDRILGNRAIFSRKDVVLASLPASFPCR
jgi:hypothetical protein